MRIKEITNSLFEKKGENSDPKKLSKAQSSNIKGMVTMPGIAMNTSSGSSYINYRFGLAMAGAPEFPTQAGGAIAGDPLLSTYTDQELEIINYAAKQVGAGPVKKMTSNRSEELSNTNTVSPIAKPKKNKYGV